VVGMERRVLDVRDEKDEEVKSSYTSLIAYGVQLDFILTSPRAVGRLLPPEQREALRRTSLSV
jgi:hypothetical protein